MNDDELKADELKGGMVSSLTTWINRSDANNLISTYADYYAGIDPIDESDSNVKMLLFARWITTEFGTPKYNVNGYDGNWWKIQLKHFNDAVYPNYEKNGSVKNTKKFLEE
jgi:hypothetical protein